MKIFKGKYRAKNQRGFTLLETMLAAAVLLIAAGGVLSLFTLALMQNNVEGDHGTRTTEYAQDKMEQLMALGFTDTTSDVTQYPTCLSSLSTCSGTGLTAGGSLSAASPTTGYVDYINTSGSPTTSAANAVYIREWQIANDSNTPTQIKTITVFVKKISEAGPVTPSTTLIVQKTNI